MYDPKPDEGASSPDPAERGPGGPAHAEPAPSDLDQLRDLAQELKRAVEGCRWQDLGELVGVPEVWAFDRPVSLPEAIGMLDEVFAGARDQHFYIQRILRTRLEGDRGHLTLTGCMMWGEVGNWKEHELEIDVHLGYARQEGGGWRIRYAGVTPGTPENVPFPMDAATAGPADEGEDAAPPGVPAGVPPAVGAAPAGGPASASWAPGAATAAPGTGALAGALAPAAGEPPPGHVVAWIPVYVPAAAVSAPAASAPPATAPAATAPRED